MCYTDTPIEYRPTEGRFWLTEGRFWPAESRFWLLHGKLILAHGRPILGERRPFSPTESPFSHPLQVNSRWWLTKVGLGLAHQAKKIHASQIRIPGTLSMKCHGIKKNYRQDKQDPLIGIKYKLYLLAATFVCLLFSCWQYRTFAIIFFPVWLFVAFSLNSTEGWLSYTQ